MMMDHILEALVKTIGPIPYSLKSEDLIKHALDASFHPSHTPDVVVWPQTTKDVQKILRFANDYEIPVTAWGGASGLEGNAIPMKSGIVLDMTKMNTVVEVMKEDFQVRVQPGIIGEELNKQLKSSGLFFPAVPGSANVATIGGMIACNAGGMQAVKYGVVGDWVLQLTVVLGSGQVITVGSRSFKSVAGYDLKRLMIGSGGTLGVITETVLKLAPIPPHKTTILASFPDVSRAGRTIQVVLRSSLEPASLELMDAYNIHLINKQCNLAWKEEPTIIIEFHEFETVRAAVLERVKEMIQKEKGTVEQIATNDEERMPIWKARWSVRPAIRHFYPELGIIPGDIGIPLSQIPSYLEKAQELSEKFEVKAVTFGHAGDGNFHTWILYTINDSDSLDRAKQMGEALVEYALSVGGTCTGEHGIGIGKRKYLPKEHPTSIEWMKKIKQLFDPKGILNPGKIFL